MFFPSDVNPADYVVPGAGAWKTRRRDATGYFDL